MAHCLAGFAALQVSPIASKSNSTRYTASGPKSARGDFTVAKSDKATTKNTRPQKPLSSKVEAAKTRRTAVSVTTAKLPQVKTPVLKQTSKTLNMNKGPRFPTAAHSSALHFPNKAEKVHDNLKLCSPWYQSIDDPLHGADCKIPDDCGDETGTLQCVSKGQVTVPPIAAGNSCGVQINTPYSCQLGLANQGYSESAASSTVSALAWLAGTQWDTSATLIDFAQAHRVVSVGLYVQPECSIADCSGEMTFFSSPMDYDASTSYDYFVNKYGSTTIALNSLDPFMIRWFPFSKGDQTFKSFYRPKAAQVGSFGADSVPFWQMGFITAGVPEGVTFRFTIAINYEFLPQFNAINILDVAPSPVDSTEVDLVENWISTEPAAKVVSQAKMTDPPSTVEPQHAEPSKGDGFGMFTDVLRELVPIALEGLSVFL